MTQSVKEQDAQEKLDDQRKSRGDAKPGVGDWAVLILVGGFAIGVVIACWFLIAQIRLGPP